MLQADPLLTAQIQFGLLLFEIDLDNNHANPPLPKNFLKPK
jgi:hypothetical protein